MRGKHSMHAHVHMTWCLGFVDLYPECTVVGTLEMDVKCVVRLSRECHWIRIAREHTSETNTICVGVYGGQAEVTECRLLRIISFSE
jgi:hypothetical protein